jgi:hypothetical protein
MIAAVNFAGVSPLPDAATFTTAFALAGLGGFNAHGAGFLAAATACEVAPDLVTATSGQIVVLADWLQGKNLEESLVSPELEHNATAQLTVLLTGEQGVFRPAYLEAMMRWWTPPSSMKDMFDSFFNRLLPAQVYVPTRDAADFANIARVFNVCRDIGIVFNAYNLSSGEAVLYGNAKARELWHTDKAIPDATQSVGACKAAADKKEPDPKRERERELELQLQPITAEAVKSALWLSLYGFDHLPQPHLMDGAYHRACLVSELHTFNRIFVARPLSQGWPGHGPRNWFEVQDWQTEMWFSAGYKAEVDALNQINGLVKAKLLHDPFKVVQLIEIAPPTPAGFFNYFIERKRVYNRAVREAVEAFEKLELCSPERAKQLKDAHPEPPGTS